MFCNKCGKELENDARFCNSCGTEIKRELVEDDTIKPSKATSVKKIGVLAKTVIIVMAVIIIAMGSYIVVDIVGNNDNQTNTDIEMVEDKNVDLAISALTLQWKELYKEDKAGDGHLEIVHTRVVKIDPSADNEFFSKLDKGDLIEYMVEFTLYSDYFSSAPYYHNANTCDTVIIYSDGTTNVGLNVLRLYSTRTYSYDYSKLVKNVKDYGTAFNKTIDLR